MNKHNKVKNFINKKIEQKKEINPQVEEAIKKNCCTFIATGPNFSYQKWYFCKTCGLDGNKGCCQSCANVCHKGHELSEAKESSCKFIFLI